MLRERFHFMMLMTAMMAKSNLQWMGKGRAGVFQLPFSVHPALSRQTLLLRSFNTTGSQFLSTPCIISFFFPVTK